MMRLNFKTILLVIVVAILSSILTSWNNCGSPQFFKSTEWKAKFQHRVSKYYCLNFIDKFHGLVYS